MIVQMPFGRGVEASSSQAACEILLNNQATAQLEPIVDAALAMLADMASYWSVDAASQPHSKRAAALHGALFAEWSAVVEGKRNDLDLCHILADAIELSMHSSMQDPAAIRLRDQVLVLSSKAIAGRGRERPKKNSAVRWGVLIVVGILGATALGLVWND